MHIHHQKKILLKKQKKEKNKFTSYKEQKKSMTKKIKKNVDGSCILKQLNPGRQNWIPGMANFGDANDNDDENNPLQGKDNINTLHDYDESNQQNDEISNMRPRNQSITGRSLSRRRPFDEFDLNINDNDGDGDHEEVNHGSTIDQEYLDDYDLSSMSSSSSDSGDDDEIVEPTSEVAVIEERRNIANNNIVNSDDSDDNDDGKDADRDYDKHDHNTDYHFFPAHDHHLRVRKLKTTHQPGVIEEPIRKYVIDDSKKFTCGNRNNCIVADVHHMRNWFRWTKTAPEITKGRFSYTYQHDIDNTANSIVQKNTTSWNCVFVYATSVKKKHRDDLRNMKFCKQKTCLGAPFCAKHLKLVTGLELTNPKSYSHVRLQSTRNYKVTDDVIEHKQLSKDIQKFQDAQSTSNFEHVQGLQTDATSTYRKYKKPNLKGPKPAKVVVDEEGNEVEIIPKKVGRSASLPAPLREPDAMRKKESFEIGNRLIAVRQRENQMQFQDNDDHDTIQNKHRLIYNEKEFIGTFLNLPDGFNPNENQQKQLIKYIKSDDWKSGKTIQTSPILSYVQFVVCTKKKEYANAEFVVSSNTFKQPGDTSFLDDIREMVRNADGHTNDDVDNSEGQPNKNAKKEYWIALRATKPIFHLDYVVVYFPKLPAHREEIYTNPDSEFAQVHVLREQTYPIIRRNNIFKGIPFANSQEIWDYFVPTQKGVVEKFDSGNKLKNPPARPTRQQARDKRLRVRRVGGINYHENLKKGEREEFYYLIVDDKKIRKFLINNDGEGMENLFPDAENYGLQRSLSSLIFKDARSRNTPELSKLFIFPLQYGVQLLKRVARSFHGSHFRMFDDFMKITSKEYRLAYLKERYSKIHLLCDPWKEVDWQVNGKLGPINFHSVETLKEFARVISEMYVARNIFVLYCILSLCKHKLEYLHVIYSCLKRILVNHSYKDGIKSIQFPDIIQGVMITPDRGTSLMKSQLLEANQIMLYVTLHQLTLYGLCLKKVEPNPRHDVSNESLGVPPIHEIPEFIDYLFNIYQGDLTWEQHNRFRYMEKGIHYESQKKFASILSEYFSRSKRKHIRKNKIKTAYGDIMRLHKPVMNDEMLIIEPDRDTDVEEGEDQKWSEKMLMNGDLGYDRLETIYMDRDNEVLVSRIDRNFIDFSVELPPQAKMFNESEETANKTVLYVPTVTYHGISYPFAYYENPRTNVLGEVIFRGYATSNHWIPFVRNGETGEMTIFLVETPYLLDPLNVMIYLKKTKNSYYVAMILDPETNSLVKYQPNISPTISHYDRAERAMIDRVPVVEQAEARLVEEAQPLPLQQQQQPTMDNDPLNDLWALGRPFVEEQETPINNNIVEQGTDVDYDALWEQEGFVPFEPIPEVVHESLPEIPSFGMLDGNIVFAEEKNKKQEISKKERNESSKSLSRSDSLDIVVLESCEKHLTYFLNLKCRRMNKQDLIKLFDSTLQKYKFSKALTHKSVVDVNDWNDFIWTILGTKISSDLHESDLLEIDRLYDDSKKQSKCLVDVQVKFEQIVCATLLIIYVSFLIQHKDLRESLQQKQTLYDTLRLRYNHLLDEIEVDLKTRQWSSLARKKSRLLDTIILTTKQGLSKNQVRFLLSCMENVCDSFLIQSWFNI